MSPSARKALIARLRAAGCVFAEDEADLLLASTDDARELEVRVRRRESGAPLEHVVGWAAFRGIRVIVCDGVFIPRVRSEHLVDAAVTRLSEGDDLIEVCCGSGALALACALEVPGIRLVASDLDPVAVECARENLAGYGTVVVGDLFSALPVSVRGRARVVIANVPYVPTAELVLLPRDAHAGEPRVTHDGGEDGLDVFRRVVAQVGGWLAPDGALLVELHASQSKAAREIVDAAGLCLRIDEHEHGQCVGTIARDASVLR